MNHRYSGCVPRISDDPVRWQLLAPQTTPVQADSFRHLLQELGILSRLDVGTYHLAHWAYRKAEESCCPSWEDVEGGEHSKGGIPGPSASSAVRTEGRVGSLGGFYNRIVMESTASAPDCGCLADRSVSVVEADTAALSPIVALVFG